MVTSFPGSDTLSETPWVLQKQRTRGGVGGREETGSLTSADYRNSRIITCKQTSSLNRVEGESSCAFLGRAET